MKLALRGVFGGKPWWRSMTAWGLLIWKLGDLFIQQACIETGLLSPDQCAPILTGVNALGDALIVLGIRKQLGGK